MTREETRSLSCIGLSAHETATVRLVLTSLRDRLDADWHLVNQNDADVVVADPKTAAGRAVFELASDHTDVIAVIDRHVGERPPTDYYLYRPLRPATLVDLLNQSGFLPSTSDTAAETALTLGDLGTGWPKTATEALREAMRDTPVGSIDVLEGFGGELAIDIERDRLMGPVDALQASVLTDTTTYPVYRLYAPLARARAASAHEMPLTVGLWRLLANLERDRALYGVADHTPVRLTRWPRLPWKRLARRQLRAATALRHRAGTASEIAREVGIDEADVLTLCNGAWLTGDLETAERSAATTQRTSATETSHHSLVSRIRQRLGVT